MAKHGGMHSALRQQENYEYKMAGTLGTGDAAPASPYVSEVVKGKLPLMHRYFAAAAVKFTNYRHKVVQVLNSEGVSIIQYPFYLAFGGEMGSLKGRIAGEGYATEAATLIAKWVSRGLSQSVLEAIRSQVFDIGAPTP